MDSYKIYNKKGEEHQCFLIGENQTYKSENFILSYDSKDKEVVIQTSPTKTEISESIEWDIDDTEYFPFVKNIQVYEKKKNIGGIDSISGMHIAKCGTHIFIISSEIDITV